MGCWHSRIEREETVSRCKARKRYMKQFVEARHAFSSSHAMYIRSLRATASALLHFANSEITHHHHNHNHHLAPEPQPSPAPIPPSQPPMSPSSDTWTSVTTSPAFPPPPPPPSVPSSSAWDFWDPFVPPPPPSTEEEWEASATTTTTKENSSELAMVVSRNNKDLVEVVRELNGYFLKAADAGAHVSLLLEVPKSDFCSQSNGSML